MSNPLAHVPTPSNGKLIVVATIVVNPGKEARFQELLQDAKAHVASGAEPHTLSYRVTRNITADGFGNKFVVFEEYLGVEGMKEHMATPPLIASSKAVKEENIIASVDFAFCEEI